MTPYLHFSLIFLFLPNLILSQEFHTPCNPSLNQTCTPGKFLACLNNSCDCEDPENQIYDAVEAQCVIVAGKPCVPEYSPDIPLCIQGAECNPDTNTCQCSKGFYETELNICSYTIGRTCQESRDCDGANGLVCSEGVCRCPNSSFIWQMEYGCVNTAELATNNSTPTTTTTTTDPSPIIFVNKPINPPISDNMVSNENMVPVSEEVQTTTPAGNVDENPTTFPLEQEDRDGFPSTTRRSPLANFVNQVIPPILNPLNPNHPFRPARPTFVPASQFMQPALQQQQQQQQTQQTTTHPITHLHPNVVPNNFHAPRPLPANIASPPIPQRPLRPGDIFNLRRVLHPIKRFLFPRLFAPREAQPGDVELPSPIYIAVASINRILPILRVIDYQMAPVLQNLAAITRPRYLDNFIGQDNLNYQQQQYHQGQVQQLGRTDDYFTEEELAQVQSKRRRNPLFSNLLL